MDGLRFSRDHGFSALYERGAFGECSFARHAAFFTRSFLAFLCADSDLFDALTQSGEVTDCRRLSHSLANGGEGLIDFLCRQGCQAIFEELDRGFQVGKTTGVQGEGIVRETFGETADEALIFAVFHPDVPLCVDTPEVDGELFIGLTGRGHSFRGVGGLGLFILRIERSGHDVPSLTRTRGRPARMCTGVHLHAAVWHISHPRGTGGELAKKFSP